MNVAFLGLGGNIGDRFENIQKTIQLLEQHCGEIKKRSGIYETEAWGSDSDKKYFNQVVELHTAHSPLVLLEKTLKIEGKLGRNRSKNQNSDRTVDIDLLFFNDVIIDSEELHIPHPRLHLRKFVLIPLCELWGATLHPVFKKEVRELLETCEDVLKVTRVYPEKNI